MIKLSYQKIKLVQQLVTVENTFLLRSHYIYFNTLALQLYFNLTSIFSPRYLIVGLKHFNKDWQFKNMYTYNMSVHLNCVITQTLIYKVQMYV